MSAHEPELSPVEERIAQVAEEFFASVDRGERPSLTAYAERYPEIADDIRRTFPALLLLGGDSNEKSANEIGISAESPRTLGDFRIIRELGRGGMGAVFEAEQLSMGRRVALKVLPFAALANEQMLQRFRNEVRAAAALDHPHIVSVYSVGEERGVHYYAMQLIRGQTLAEFIGQLRLARQNASPQNSSAAAENHAPAAKAPAPQQTTLASGGETTQTPSASASASTSARRAASYFRNVAQMGIQAAEALQYAHDQGVLHRDIKPGNLLLDGAGQLYITDFGLARIEADAGLTMTGDVLGTLRYMAPEQASGKRIVVDHRADIYSLGVTLYELLCLEPAFGEADRADLLQQVALRAPLGLRKIDPKIPVDLETIVQKAIGKERETRYQTAHQLADDLRAYLEHRPIKARPLSFVGKIRKWSRRHQSLVTLAFIALMVLSIVLSAAMVFLSQAEVRTRAALNTTARMLYEADMALAFQGNMDGLGDEALEIVNRHRPKSGEVDQRGLEWNLLHAIVRKPESFDLLGHIGSVNEIALFPDRDQLASVGDDGTLRIWSLTTRKLLRELKLGNEPLYSVAVSPDGRYVAAGSHNVLLCDLASNGQVQSIFHNENNFESLAFRPDGKALAAGARYQAVFLLSLTGEVLGRVPCGSRITSLEFLADEKVLLFPSRKPGVDRPRVGFPQLWKDDLSALQKEFDFKIDGDSTGVTTARTCPDGKYLLLGEHDEARVSLFERKTNQLLGVTNVARSRVEDLAIAPDGQAAAVGYENGLIAYYWVRQAGHLDLQAKPYVFHAHQGEVLALHFVSANTLVTCGKDGAIRIWMLSLPMSRAYDISATSVVAVKLSPDGEQFIFADKQGYGLVNIASGLILKRFPAVVDSIGVVAYSPKGDRFAISLGPDTAAPICVFDRQGQLLHQFATVGIPQALAYSPDGKRISIISNMHLVIHDALSGEILFRKQLENQGRAVAYSPDGTRIAFGGFSDAITLANADQPQIESKYHAGVDTTCLAFSPDNKWLASGHGDGRIQLWDAATGQKVSEFSGHERLMRDLIFTPDSRTLISAGTEGTVRMWSIPSRRSYGVFFRSAKANQPLSRQYSCNISMSADSGRFAIAVCPLFHNDVDVLLWDLTSETSK